MLAFAQDAFDLESLLLPKAENLLDLAFGQDCHYCGNKYCSTAWTAGPLTTNELCNSRLTMLNVLHHLVANAATPPSGRCCYDKGLHAGATGKVTEQMRFEHAQEYFAYTRSTWGNDSFIGHIRDRALSEAGGASKILDRLAAQAGNATAMSEDTW